MDALRVGTTAGSLSALPAPDDMQWGLQDVSASDAGRVQDANVTMHKNRIAQKRKITLAWKNRSDTEVAQILTAFNPEYVYVEYRDPMSNDTEVRVFYVGDRSAPYRQIRVDGAEYSNLSFSIIER